MPYPSFINDNIIHLHKELASELVGIGLSVSLIDAGNQLIAVRQRKEQLILQMRSKDNAAATQAVEELKAKGWLYDGSLHNAELFGANLLSAELENAYLKGANFNIASLRSAHLRDANLEGACLLDANMKYVNARGVNFKNANLTMADLTNAIFVDVNLEGATMEDEHFKQIARLDNAILPDGSLYKLDPSPDIELEIVDSIEEQD